MGGKLDCFSCVAAGGPRLKTWGVVSKLNEHHMAWAWWSLFAVCFADFYVRMCSMGADPRPEVAVMERHEVHEHDVLVVGAGGAGLRAAIEASAMGCRVGLVTKSLLGKAHTVMAEGGIAAALAHVDPQDGWETHFRDTMKGGSFLNHWRMAQLHAQESPDRVRELEQWGALFDRTPRRPHPAARIRRPHLEAPRARR